MLPTLITALFCDLSPDKDHEYFCQGLADELINSLGALHGLRVVARTSAFAVHALGLAVPASRVYSQRRRLLRNGCDRARRMRPDREPAEPGVA